MRTVHDIAELRTLGRPVALAAGVYDGVHAGHREVLDRARLIAGINKGEAWVLTFDPHPLRILRPQAAPALLTSTRHKLRLLGLAGVDGCVVQPFTRAFADLEPEVFIDALCSAVPTLAALVVGHNWTFGHRARGDVNLLRDLAKARGFHADIVPGLEWNGGVVSSSRIREAVLSARLEDAAAMLGRPFSVLGTVVRGKQIGRTLGFPTANVFPDNEVRPPAGSYAARARWRDRMYSAAAYVGSPRHHAPGVVEVHFIGQNVELYNEEIEVFFVSQIRADEKFESLDALKVRIAEDVKACADRLSRAE